jgi:hypothetical protein
MDKEGKTIASYWLVLACNPSAADCTLDLTFSLYSLAAGLALSRIPQHSQNSSVVIR